MAAGQYQIDPSNYVGFTQGVNSLDDVGSLGEPEFHYKNEKYKITQLVENKDDDIILLRTTPALPIETLNNIVIEIDYKTIAGGWDTQMSDSQPSTTSDRGIDLAETDTVDVKIMLLSRPSGFTVVESGYRAVMLTWDDNSNSHTLGWQFQDKIGDFNYSEWGTIDEQRIVKFTDDNDVAKVSTEVRGLPGNINAPMTYQFRVRATGKSDAIPYYGPPSQHGVYNAPALEVPADLKVHTVDYGAILEWGYSFTVNTWFYGFTEVDSNGNCAASTPGW